MPEDIALFIDFENIRYSMLNIQRREPDPQELIAVARRYGTVMVARAYADWSRQPEPFKGSLTAAMIDRVDCPAKQRDRIRMGTVHYANGIPTGALSDFGYRTGPLGNSGPLPAITPQQLNGDWAAYQENASLDQADADTEERPRVEDDLPAEENYGMPDYQQRETLSQPSPYSGSYGQASPTGSLGFGNAGGNTGPLTYPPSSIGNTGHMPAVNSASGHMPAISSASGHMPAISSASGHMPAVSSAGGNSTVVQSTVIQSTVDLNMLMDIIETVFDRPTISTFVLMTGDKDFTRISARLKLRLNKTVIVVGIPGTVSRDLISSANQFVPLVPGGNPAALGQASNGGFGSLTGNTGSMPAVSLGAPPSQFQPYPMDVLDPQFLQFLDYIDRNWSWRTVIGVSNFIGDPINPKNRFRGRLTRESARELLNLCIQQGILLLQTDPSGAEDLRLNRNHPGVDDVLKQFVR